MRVTIDGVAYVVTQSQCQTAFHMMQMTAERHSVLPGAATRPRQVRHSPTGGS